MSEAHGSPGPDSDVPAGTQVLTCVAMHAFPQHWWSEGPSRVCENLRKLLQTFGDLALEPQLTGLGAIAAYTRPEAARSAVGALHGIVCQMELKSRIDGAAML